MSKLNQVIANYERSQKEKQQQQIANKRAAALRKEARDKARAEAMKPVYEYELLEDTYLWGTSGAYMYMYRRTRTKYNGNPDGTVDYEVTHPSLNREYHFDSLEEAQKYFNDYEAQYNRNRR